MCIHKLTTKFDIKNLLKLKTIKFVIQIFRLFNILSFEDLYFKKKNTT